MRDWGRDCWCPSGRDNTCGRRFNGQHGALPYGYDHKYVYAHPGYNLKATEMQAAIGCAQIEKLPVFIQKRKENFDILREGMESLKDIFILPQKTPESDPSWFGFLLILRDEVSFTRNDITTFLENKKIKTRTLFGGNLVRQPCIISLAREMDYRIVGSLTNTDKIMRDGFWIGVYPGLTERMLSYILSQMGNFLTFDKKDT